MQGVSRYSDSRLNIGIAGAGLLGRLLAWTLAHQGHQVSVFDPAAGPGPSFDGQGAAGFTAAGMLSPLAELDAYVAWCKTFYKGNSRDTFFLHWLIDDCYAACFRAA